MWIALILLRVIPDWNLLINFLSRLNLDLMLTKYSPYPWNCYAIYSCFISTFICINISFYLHSNLYFIINYIIFQTDLCSPTHSSSLTLPRLRITHQSLRWNMIISKDKDKDKTLPSLEKENLEVFGVLCHGDFSLDHLLFQVNKTSHVTTYCSG